MPTRTYDRLAVEDFGRQLIVSGDLDPIYVALFGAGFEEQRLGRWLIAYWCLYHAGVASWLSEQEGEDFWHWLRVAAFNEVAAPTGGRWPRAKERRHWRGQQAIRSVVELSERWPEPAAFIDYLCLRTEEDDYSEEPRAFKDVAKRVKEHRGFGDWIAFKIADMMDCCLGISVDFTQSEIFMYKDPVEGALMVWRRQAKLPDFAKPKDQKQIINEVVKWLQSHLVDLTAPPAHERTIGLQEVETVLCKWKSHIRGHYPLFNDIDEITAGLQPWLAHSEAARQFLEAMPRRDENG